MVTQLLSKFINRTGIVDRRRTIVTEEQNQQLVSLQVRVAVSILRYKLPTAFLGGGGRDTKLR